MGHHRDDAGGGLRGGGRDLGDPAAGDGAAGEGGVDHAVEGELPGEAGLARHLLRSVDAGDRPADVAVLEADQRVGLAARQPAVGRQRDDLGHGALGHALRELLGVLEDAHARSPAAVCRQRDERRDDRAACEFHLEGVVPERPRLGQLRLGGGAEARLGGRLAAQRRLGGRRPPWPVRDAAERHPDVGDDPVLDRDRRGDGDEREGVARPVAHLAVGRVLRHRQRRELDGGDQLAGLQRRVALGMVAREPMELEERQAPDAGRTLHVDDGIERGQRDAHVGGMDGDARLRGAEDRVIAVEAVDRVAALAGVALVAARSVVVVEIGAAGALEQVAADGGHVADLRAGAGDDGAGQQRIAGADQPVLGQRRCCAPPRR